MWRLNGRWWFFWAASVLVTTIDLPAQQATAPVRIDVYRYVLDVDVPEPAALVALELASSRALLAAAPKPLAMHVSQSIGRGSAPAALAFDVSPYYLAGAGNRSLSSFTDNSIAGRLRRVLIKTVLSAGVATDYRIDASTRVGLAVRATIHDPHDPVLNWGLADSVRQRTGARDPGSTESAPAPDAPVGEQADDLRDLFARARDAVRARCCTQVALGWATAFPLEDQVGDARREGHQFWATFQITTGARYDVLVTPRVLDVLHDPRAALGLGLQRKAARADLRAELYYDSNGDFLPGAALDVSLAPSLALTAVLAGERRAGRSSMRTGIQLKTYRAQRG